MNYEKGSLNDIQAAVDFLCKDDDSFLKRAIIIFKEKLKDEFHVNQDNQNAYKDIKNQYRSEDPMWIGKKGKHLLFDLYDKGYLAMFLEKMNNKQEEKEQEEKQIFAATINQLWQGKTLLMHLAEQKSLHMIKLLLTEDKDNKIDLDQENTDNKTLEEVVNSLQDTDITVTGDVVGPYKKEIVTNIKSIKKKREYITIKGTFDNTTWENKKKGTWILHELVEKDLLGLFQLALYEKKEEEKSIYAMLPQKQRGKNLLVHCLHEIITKMEQGASSQDDAIQKYGRAILLLVDYYGDECINGKLNKLIPDIGDKDEECLGKLANNLPEDIDIEKKNLREVLLTVLDKYKDDKKYNEKQEKIREKQQKNLERLKREDKERKQETKLYTDIVDRCRDHGWKDPAHNNQPLLFSLYAYKEDFLSRALRDFDCYWDSAAAKFLPATLNDVYQGETLLLHLIKKGKIALVQDIFNCNRGRSYYENMEDDAPMRRGKAKLTIDVNHKDSDGHDFKYYFDKIDKDELDKKDYDFILRQYKKYKKIALLPIVKKVAIGVVGVGIVGLGIWWYTQRKKKNSKKQHIGYEATSTQEDLVPTPVERV